MFVVHLTKARSLLVSLSLLLDWVTCLQYINDIHFKVSHIYRKGNMVADVLSQMDFSVSSSQWSFSLPQNVGMLMQWICGGIIALVFFFSFLLLVLFFLFFLTSTLSPYSWLPYWVFFFLLGF